MEFHEKSLELNITHELLNLTDKWYWFLHKYPLWEYWNPGYKIPFFNPPKSTAGGFHITTEGKDDPTGEAGGGFDVRIKSGIGNHLLFIQYKKGDFITKSPANSKSEFSTPPHEHFKFEINGTTTNQHFVLRNLAMGIGNEKGNAVVYAFPLIKDMNDLENNAGKLLRKTKFISVADIDQQAKDNKVSFTRGKKHNFRICQKNMNRCEVNFFFFSFYGEDKAPNIISDVIALSFEKNLKAFLKLTKDRERYFFRRSLQEHLKSAYINYVSYLFHFFEISPNKITDNNPLNDYGNISGEYNDYENAPHDIAILKSVLNELYKYWSYINSIAGNISIDDVPKYEPKFLITINSNSDFHVTLEEGKEIIEDLTYLIF